MLKPGDLIVNDIEHESIGMTHSRDPGSLLTFIHWVTTGERALVVAIIPHNTPGSSRNVLLLCGGKLGWSLYNTVQRRQK